jgi:DNA invertase Pin-like site-specific DNA recombinase
MGKERAKSLGLEPVILNDGVCSASHLDTSNRPKFEHLIYELIPNRKTKNVYGRELTRISRNDVNSLAFLQACEKHKVIIVTNSHYPDVTDAAQYCIAQLEYGLAKLES